MRNDMRNVLFAAILMIVPLCGAVESLAEAEAKGLEAKGAAALNASQKDENAIVTAVKMYGRAAELYSKIGNEPKAVEMNSYLYWCKKKMTLAQMEGFLHSGDVPQAVAKRVVEVDKVTPKLDEVKLYYERAEAFSQMAPNDHMLIAIRFYEVADRFKGHELSLKAQDRSLKEIMLASRAPVPVVAPVVPKTPIKFDAVGNWHKTDGTPMVIRNNSTVKAFGGVGKWKLEGDGVKLTIVFPGYGITLCTVKDADSFVEDVAGLLWVREKKEDK